MESYDLNCLFDIFNGSSEAEMETAATILQRIATFISPAIYIKK